MKNSPHHARDYARSYVRDLAAAGRYSFSSADARQALGGSAAAVKLALLRLTYDRELASPARGFYVVVPPEYRAMGCPPADQFIPALMARAGQPCYAGLLSAAQYHGAAHHRPQEFQVMVAKERRSLRCGRVRVAFIVRKELGEVPVQSFNTPRGTIFVSTPEATAFDLVGYQRRVGGLDHVATILAELAERLDPEKLASAARSAPVSWVQRLGYLLERVDAADKAAALKDYVATVAKQPVLLLPGTSIKKAHREAAWKLAVNVEVEAET
jgi:predicted transcriptional regulator of viral defense system